MMLSRKKSFLITVLAKSLTLKCLFFFCHFAFSRASPMAHGGSQARAPIRAVAADLHHSHSNKGSEPLVKTTPQLMAMSDHLPTE